MASFGNPRMPKNSPTNLKKRTKRKQKPRTLKCPNCNRGFVKGSKRYNAHVIECRLTTNILNNNINNNIKLDIEEEKSDRLENSRFLELEAENKELKNNINLLINALITDIKDETIIIGEKIDYFKKQEKFISYGKVEIKIEVIVTFQIKVHVTEKKRV